MNAISISTSKTHPKALRLLLICLAASAFLVAGCDVERDEADAEESDITVLDQKAEDGLPTDEEYAEQPQEPFPEETMPGDRTPEDMPGQRSPTERAPGETSPERSTAEQTSPSTSMEPGGDPTTEESAVAKISPVGDSSVEGEIRFTSETAAVQITGQLTGLEPGKHGFHIHEGGQCDMEGDAAGGHLSPDEDPHGAPSEEPGEHHLGDLGNITANEDGTAEINFQDPEIRLARTGPDAIIGKALIVHIGEDDLTSQPSGESGQPVGCGVIEIAQDQQQSVGSGRG